MCRNRAYLREGGAGVTIQELFEWGNENDVLNEPVSIPDIYEGGWTIAEGVEKKEAHGVIEIRLW